MRSNLYLPKVGFENNFSIIKTLILNKFLQYNYQTIPTLKNLKISFPIFDSSELTKSKLLIIAIDLLESISGLYGNISQVKIFSKKGIFLKCQVYLSRFFSFNFFSFLNDFILSNELLNFSYKPMKLVHINKKTFKLLIFDMDLFFDSYTRRYLPSVQLFWLEIDFFFSKNSKPFYKNTLYLYTQLFFSHFFLKKK
jgi:hypothetical protein